MSEQQQAAEVDAVREARRACFALHLEVHESIARDVKARFEAALAQVWDEGYVAGQSFGYEYAQDTYEGPSEDPTENPYKAVS